MAHRLAIPPRSVRKTIWLLSVTDGAPVVKVQWIGRLRTLASVARRPAARVTEKVVFGGSDPEGVKRTMLRAWSVRPAAPSGATTPRLPATDGTMLSMPPLRLLGSM